jgi:cell division septum initiation protein DivIVA
VAEAYEAVYKENQTFNRRLEELKEQLNNAPAQTQAPQAAPSAPAVRSESEDMLKRMLVTAQETADKAVANARAKAQMLVDEAEIKARRIEEQADSVSSTTLQDAQRRARDILTTAQQDEGELRDRIEGMKSFEREFRSRLSAFIRSQLELLETKPLIATSTPGPVTSPFFDRSKLLSETIEKFGDYGLSRSAASSVPALEAAPAEPAPEPEPEPEAAAVVAPEPEPAPVEEPPSTVVSTPDWLSEPDTSATSSVPDEPPSWAPESTSSAGDGNQASVAASTSDEQESARKKSSASETKSIHELFWGED